MGAAAKIAREGRANGATPPTPNAPVVQAVPEIDPETGELTAPEELRAIENGRPCDPARAWIYARAISEQEYEALTGVRDHHEFMAATHVAVDLGEIAPIRP